MTEPLFTPLTLGAATLQHRVVMAPLTRMRAGDGNGLQGMIARVDEDGKMDATFGTDGVVLIDRELLRFEVLWAAAGHPHAVFALSPADLERLTGAPLADVTESPIESPSSPPAAP